MSEYIYEHSQCYDQFGKPLDAPMLTQREEIVRCRDCIYYDDYLGSCVRGNAHQVRAAEPDGFCKWGVRREGSDNG